MKISARPSAFVAIVTACALLFQFGACAFSSKPQKVPVTSSPVGAKIIVDGREAGATPLTLTLKRNTNHAIRIEKPGYNPVEIMLVRKVQTGQTIGLFGLGLIMIPLFGFLGGLVGLTMTPKGSCSLDEMSNAGLGFFFGALSGAIVMLVISSKTSGTLLTPAVLEVALEKTEMQARTNVVILDRDQVKDLRWIRISCAEGGEAAVVAVN